MSKLKYITLFETGDKKLNALFGKSEEIFDDTFFAKDIKGFKNTEIVDIKKKTDVNIIRYESLTQLEEELIKNEKFEELDYIKSVIETADFLHNIHCYGTTKQEYSFYYDLKTDTFMTKLEPTEIYKTFYRKEIKEYIPVIKYKTFEIKNLKLLENWVYEIEIVNRNFKILLKVPYCKMELPYVINSRKVLKHFYNLTIEA